MLQQIPRFLICERAKILLSSALLLGVGSYCEPGMAGEVLSTALIRLHSNDEYREPRSSAEKSLLAEYLAYEYLMRADAFLASDNRSEVEANFPLDTREFRSFDSLSSEKLSSWAKRVSKEEFAPNKNADVAIASLNKAMSELELSSDPLRKLEMYFIASILLRRAGDNSDSKKCEQYIENYIRSCESGESLNEKRFSAAVALLGIKAYSLVNVNIPDEASSDPISFAEKALPNGPPSSQALVDSELLLLRGVIIADRLHPVTDLRRMVHRNLCLWYQIVGKTEQAEEQKLILFELIGIYDDRLLYPLKGQGVWWTLPRKSGDPILQGYGTCFDEFGARRRN